MDNHKILVDIRNVIENEGKALLELADHIGLEFSIVVKAIFSTKGRIVVTGIGKSAIVGSKIVATLNSTGTNAVFLHAADAIHGDLGMITKDDIILCISKSGNTPEIKLLVQLIKDFGNSIIGMTSEKESFLAKASDHTLILPMQSEADPNNLAPTTSTTLQMAVGDALAIALQNLRGFDANQFAKFHPGGSLGKKLYLRVNDVITHHSKPKVYIGDSIDQVIIEISTGRLGAVAVLNKNEIMVGIITDGDLRRMLGKDLDYHTLKADQIMTSDPKSIQKSALAYEALRTMRQYSITQLIVLDEHQSYEGLIHLHDLLREGIV
ncbi:MAG: KpsF/GutQ family sugar-phosphate isomerase [Saprospiraceae bacterium]